jgi:hypothetical protein
MNRPKNQHWVPQSYLRHFATPDTRDSKTPKIWRFDKARPSEHPHLRSVREVCSSNYLYSPIGADGERSWTTETLLGEVETACGELWVQLNSGEADLGDPTLRNALGRFVGAQQLRSMYVFKLYDRSLELRDKLYPLKDDYEPKDGLDARDAARLFSQKVERDLSRMSELYLRKPWMIMRHEADVFVTSDLPLIHVRTGGGRGGPGTPNTTAVFPLGPRSILAMDERFSASANETRVTTEEFVRIINAQLWHHCQRELLTGRPPADVAHEIGIAHPS